MIQDCNNRPVGMSVSEWCQEHSITTANYYYRMTQVRKACLDSLPSEVVEQAIVPVPTNLMTNGNYSFAETNQECDESFIELSAHGVTLRVTENTSSSLLSKVLGVLAHVE
nr:IS66 family insertion sequence element accessory protein TnpB [Roseburia sp. 831b]